MFQSFKTCSVFKYYPFWKGSSGKYGKHQILPLPGNIVHASLYLFNICVPLALSNILGCETWTQENLFNKYICVSHPLFNILCSSFLVGSKTSVITLLLLLLLLLLLPSNYSIPTASKLFAIWPLPPCILDCLNKMRRKTKADVKQTTNSGLNNKICLPFNPSFPFQKNIWKRRRKRTRPQCIGIAM